MPSWRDEYLGSLRDSELRNPVNMELVQTCSEMADRISALESEKAMLLANSPTKEATITGKAGELRTDDAEITQLRLDLASSLRSKGTTEARLRSSDEELIKLRTKTNVDSRSLKSLNSEVTTLTTRLKDREHELREKRKLLENVQDEMITLNLQVSMAEKERDKVKRENKDLVDRWMRRMGQEADAMNLANEPHFERGR